MSGVVALLIAVLQWQQLRSSVSLTLPVVGCDCIGGVCVSGGSMVVEQGACTRGLHGCFEWCESMECKSGGALHALLDCLSVCPQGEDAVLHMYALQLVAGCLLSEH